MNSIKYFESPLGMFEFTKEVFFRYYEYASEADFILLIFLLYHLREQIVEGRKIEEIVNIAPSERTEGQVLFLKLWQMSEFQIIREICNGIKHHKIDKEVLETEGFICGLSRCGDRLDQRYFLIDGADSRDIFLDVFNQYRIFFDGEAVNQGMQGDTAESRG